MFTAWNFCVCCRHLLSSLFWSTNPIVCSYQLTVWDHTIIFSSLNVVRKFCFLSVMLFEFRAKLLKFCNIPNLVTHSLRSCSYPKFVWFLWVIWYHFIAHKLLACNIASFLSSCIYTWNFSKLNRFLSVNMFHFIAHLLEAWNGACFFRTLGIFRLTQTYCLPFL